MNENINDITQSFGTMYIPKLALVVYQTEESNPQTYIEHFDMDENGSLINAHPLTVKEGQALAKALNTEKEENDKAFLRPKGIIPTNVLHLNPGENGSAVWYTQSQIRPMFFIENLGIPNGKAHVPPMVWKASKNGLSVYALLSGIRPKADTSLYFAPFLNVYENNKVCMGTVDIRIKKSTSLEEFMQTWEDSFFNSYFSHLINGHNPINDNCVTFWKEQISTGRLFPNNVLIKNKLTLKDVIK